jgi:hypothetical protein
MHHLDLRKCMHKQRVERTTNGHTHFQFARLSLCQYIEWQIPILGGKGLILCQHVMSFGLLDKNHKWKERVKFFFACFAKGFEVFHQKLGSH